MHIKAGNITKGLYLNFKNQAHLVLKSQFYSPGKGSAYARVKMRNLKTGANIEFTFKSNEQVEVLDLNSKQMQFLYADQENAVFMDPHNYEQVEISLKMLGEKIKLLNSNIKIYILFDQDQNALDISLPPKVKLKITQAEDATAGDTVNAPKKPVTLETGLVIQAPLFVKTGDVLVIDTETGEYVSRAN